MELSHVFPAVLDIDTLLRSSVQPPALEVVDSLLAVKQTFCGGRLYVGY